MNKIIMNLLGLVVACFLTSSVFAEVWKLTSLDWQPYSGSDISNGGSSVLALRELLAKADIDLQIEFYPWARSQELALTSQFVGYFPAWPEEVYEGFVGSDPVDYSYLGVLTYAGSDIEWAGLENMFKNYVVGYVGTYTYSDEIKILIEKYPDSADSAPNELLLVRKLARGRNQVALTDPSVMLYTAKLENIHNIEILHPNIEKKPLLVSFRVGSDNTRNIEKLKELLKQYEPEVIQP